ncbi:HlyD family secretion protein [Terrihabitans sp. PJ23]|uniref:HlyD family secretion protein n=2 Tax=Terrihabitans rhizophilus TaxID=3092662 RepID=A0ABU4RP51_9HYPH|nr:HlyD family secretion protein [Terrihabitans sp. PJ23]MDX6806615.1 HlyD family secretion protein [Terrihabitans sp. PJ23]
MKSLSGVVRVLVTLSVVAAAAVVAWQLWVYYMVEPWTRDGRVRADVVGVAPDVSGLVSEVLVRDNQKVEQGDVLFRVDRARYELAVAQARQQVAARTATFEQARRDEARYQTLNEVAVSEQRREQARQAVAEAQAALKQSQIDQELAELNLARTDVKAAVPGVVTNFSLRPGSYVSAGVAVTALVDSESFYVVGYFEETKLGRIRIGDRAAVRLMGEAEDIAGRVESIAAGIDDREVAGTTRLLPNVNPTFSWVRLAQRVPVRIRIEDIPSGTKLIVGRTANVTVLGN